MTVPSSGSATHTRPACRSAPPPSSPKNPMSGVQAASAAFIAASDARSTSVRKSLAALPIRVSGCSRPATQHGDGVVDRGVRGLQLTVHTGSVRETARSTAGSAPGLWSARSGTPSSQIRSPLTKRRRSRRRLAARSRRARPTPSRRATPTRRRPARRPARRRRPGPRTITASCGSPKPGERLRAERDDLGDLAALDPQHVERHRAVRVVAGGAHVVRDRRLAVGAGLEDLEAPELLGAEPALDPEADDRVAADEEPRLGRHREARVLVHQRRDRVRVAVLAGLDVARQQLALGAARRARPTRAAARAGAPSGRRGRAGARC